MPVPAQQGVVQFEDHPGHHPDPYDPETAQLARGEVLAVDEQSRTITLKHGPIPGLAIAAATMEFRVTDAVALERLKPGDTLKFDADILGGVLTLIRVELLRTR